jgi:Predicted transcriptional regulator
MLTKKQKKVLDIIKNKPDINLTAIAIKLKVAKSVASVHIKNLVNQNFLRKEGRKLILTEKSAEDITRIPYYGMAQCGYNDILTEDNVVNYMPMPTEFLPLKTNDLFLIKAKGDSMEPTISDGELLLLKKKTDTNFNQNDILLCFHNEGLKIKRIKYIADETGDRHPFLISDNKAYYEPIPADETTHIVGKLIKGFKDYK